MATKNPYKISDPAYHAFSGTEHGHQVALFAWAAIRSHVDKRYELLFAIPNGGSRGADQRSASIVGGMLKAEGVKPGVSDTMLPVALHNRHGLWLEMKKPGGKESAEQIEWGRRMEEQGYAYECCDHWLKAAWHLACWLGDEAGRSEAVTRMGEAGLI